MSIEQTPKPMPSIGQALVKVKAFGLNRMDLLQREGLYPLPPQAPETMGVEFSGTIEAFGPDIKCNFNVGDTVLGLAYGGSLSFHSALLGHILRYPRSLCRIHWCFDRHASS